MKIELKWREKAGDFPFTAHHLSDGTLRLICLATVLLQPEPPASIIIDEPELGLHPFAINILGGLIRSISKSNQIILSTQSVSLLDQFQANDVIVTEKINEVSIFNRLKEEGLEKWFEDYSLSELWDKKLSKREAFIMTDWTRLNFIVEGQTEETFVNRIIKPHLASYCINVSVICVTTGRKRGRVFRGGMPNYSKIKNDVIGWLNEERDAYLTTFFDF
ncbi:MAG: DUF4276 family protein [Pseudomonadota bacterium]